MRIRVSIVWMTLAASLITSPAWAQQTIADRATMHQAMAAQAVADTANRDVVLRVLQQPEVRELAERMGVSVVQAEKAMATMTSEELAELAAPARAINDHAGGQQMIVISLTTLLLIIIAILLIAD